MIGLLKSVFHLITQVTAINIIHNTAAAEFK